jgi:hypothetical protein
MTVNVQAQGLQHKEEPFSDLECAMQCTMHELALESGIGSCTHCSPHSARLLFAFSSVAAGATFSGGGFQVPRAV